MVEKNNVKEELYEMYSGLTYHMKQLTDFVRATKDDDFYKTDLGEKVKIGVLQMTTAHLMGLTSLMFEKDEESFNPFNLEELLKNSFENEGP